MAPESAAVPAVRQGTSALTEVTWHRTVAPMVAVSVQAATARIAPPIKLSSQAERYCPREAGHTSRPTSERPAPK